MSGKLDVSRIKTASSQMPDKQIKLTLTLPDGRQEEAQYRRDLTVGYVKLQIEQKYKIPADQQEYMLSGKAMSDPLSLSDFPSLSSSGSGLITVLVLGKLEEEKHDDETGETQEADDVDHDDDDDDGDM